MKTKQIAERATTTITAMAAQNAGNNRNSNIDHHHHNKVAYIPQTGKLSRMDGIHHRAKRNGNF